MKTEGVDSHIDFECFFLVRFDFFRLGEGSTIVCPLHKSAFSLATGNLLTSIILSTHILFLSCFLSNSETVNLLFIGDVVGDWCPFPPILGPLILGNLAPPEKVSTFPVRSKGQNIEVFIDRNLKERFESKYWSGLLDAQGKATGDYY